MKKVYLAARYGRRAELLAYAAELKKRGYEVTSRWVFGSHAAEKDDRLSFDEMREFALEDMIDIHHADTVISFTDGVGVCARGGRHVEFGIAVAMLKRLILVGPRETVFHAIPPVMQFDD